MKKLILIFIALLFSLNTISGNIVSNASSNPSASDKFIFYLHGSAEEEDGANYKYEATIEAISESSAIVISESKGSVSLDFKNNIKNNIYDYKIT